MNPAVGRAIGFVVTLVGVGIRLDSTWVGTGTVILVVGSIVGVWGLVAGAFVPGAPER